MAPLTTLTRHTPSEVQALKEEALRIYHQHNQLWQDYRVLPEEEKGRQNLLYRRIEGHLWSEYGRAWGEYLKAQDVLDREIGLKENQAKAKEIRSRTCGGCFQERAANGACGC
ncbi:hypothetical protein ACIOHS_27080 [Streptomyces sp. NPDC088253]|uniref:hypothetical protein n=1 Tax=Streptomyces sp. NPDC088253 TaxID=3365846 RepID=UPI003828BD1A